MVFVFDFVKAGDDTVASWHDPVEHVDTGHAHNQIQVHVTIDQDILTCAAVDETDKKSGDLGKVAVDSTPVRAEASAVHCRPDSVGLWWVMAQLVAVVLQGTAVACGRHVRAHLEKPRAESMEASCLGAVQGMTKALTETVIVEDC